jgi:predicted DNA binding protein
LRRLRWIPSSGSLRPRTSRGGVDRERIKEVEKLGVKLEEFLQIGLEALKEVVDSSGSTLIPMYTYDRGTRRFFIAGPPSKVEKLSDTLREVYESVDVRRVRWSEVFEEYRRYALLSILSSLTERQRTILEVAYRKGFFDDVRRVGLEEFSEAVNGSKPSVSVTLRRALRKILAELYSEA